MVKHQKSHRLIKWVLSFCLSLTAIIISANSAYTASDPNAAGPMATATVAPSAAPTPTIATPAPTPAPAAKNPTGTVAVNKLNLRSGPSTIFKIIKCLVKGDRLEILEQNGDWYMVTILDGKTGWVYKHYVSLDKSGIRIKLSRSGSRTSELIEYATRFLGVKYSWGGITPDGFDCSGFTSYIFRKFQIVLPHSSALQARGGLPVARANLSCGDLVFFDTNGGLDKINHVGIYMGDGRFIHASSSHKKVIITDLKSYSIGTYITAKRYLD